MKSFEILLRAKLKDLTCEAIINIRAFRLIRAMGDLNEVTELAIEAGLLSGSVELYPGLVQNGRLTCKDGEPSSSR